MSAEVTSRIPGGQGSSPLRLSDEPDKKSPSASSSLKGSYLRRHRRRSECTENGSIGYGSSAPLESETSYSSHPGYPLKPAHSKSPSAEFYYPPQQPIDEIPYYQQHDHKKSIRSKSPCADFGYVPQQSDELPYYQSPPATSPKSISQTSSTPSSGAYVDISSSTRLTGPPGSSTSGSGGQPRTALTKKRTTPLSTYPENSYVVNFQNGNTYTKGQLLGKGGFARVYLVTDIISKKQYACKIIPKHQMQKIHMQKIAREIMIHKELNHVNVVQMHHYFEDRLNVYMLLEACPKKSLVHVLKYRGKVTEPEARYYMKQMVSGVAYIHSQRVIHRDLKPGNMFLSENMIVKIGDFGLATQPDGQRRKVRICGTPNFIAPEVLFKQSYSFEADVWALGCILYTLLVGQPPFDSSTLKDIYARICNYRYKELDDTMATRAGQDLVRMLLQPNPAFRPSLDVVKAHPYLTQEYVPATLPDSCCYQAPRLSFLEKPSSLSSSFNFPPPAANLGNRLEEPQQQQQQQQQPQKSQEKSKKKKVSRWMTSWRLPKFPRFRQRINGVLCLDGRKKCLVAQTSPSYLMSRALEECLEAIAKSTKSHSNPQLVKKYTPLFVTKWVDYSNKYGLAFQLSDKSVGVFFNDSTKMSYTHDRRRVEYVPTDEQIQKYNRERNVPTPLQQKLELLRHFTDYMELYLSEGGEIVEARDSNRRSSKNNVPLMRRWLRTSKTMVMELSGPLLQMNFFEDHTKLIVSQEPQLQPREYLITYIDAERHASTFWLNDLRDFGCSPELHERLLYIYKVAKEFAEIDTGQTR